MRVTVRARHARDIDVLCDLLRSIHASDGYPVRLQNDVRSFILTENCLAAWVSEIDATVVGHVALHTVWCDEVAALACAALGRPRSGICAVSRLFVDPTVRRRGIARELLADATNEARSRGLWPVLDVVTTYTPAVALYERAGWTRLGTIAYPMPDGTSIDEHVYAPSAV